jgi:hypothetical protein
MMARKVGGVPTLGQAAKQAGMSLFDIKRRQGTPGSQYDARSIKGIRVKGKKRKTTETRA